MTIMNKYVIIFLISLVSIKIYAQCDDAYMYKITLEKYIELRNKKSIVDTIFVLKDSIVSKLLPAKIGKVHIELLSEDNLFNSFIVILPIEFENDIRKIYLKEFSVYPENNYVDYYGAFSFIFKVKKKGIIFYKIKPC